MCSGCCGGDDKDIESRAEKIQLARREEHEGPLVGGVAVGRERLEEGWRNDWGDPLGISKQQGMDGAPAGPRDLWEMSWFREGEERTGLWSEESGPQDTHLPGLGSIPAPYQNTKRSPSVPYPTPTKESFLPLLVSPP